MGNGRLDAGTLFQRPGLCLQLVALGSPLADLRRQGRQVFGDDFPRLLGCRLHHRRQRTRAGQLPAPFPQCLGKDVGVEIGAHEARLHVQHPQAAPPGAEGTEQLVGCGIAHLQSAAVGFHAVVDLVGRSLRLFPRQGERFVQAADVLRLLAQKSNALTPPIGFVAQGVEGVVGLRLAGLHSPFCNAVRHRFDSPVESHIERLVEHGPRRGGPPVERRPGRRPTRLVEPPASLALARIGVPAGFVETCLGRLPLRLRRLQP